MAKRRGRKLGPCKSEYFTLHTKRRRVCACKVGDGRVKFVTCKGKRPPH